MRENSAKYNARLLGYLLKRHGCTNIVVAPGSRNAPLIMALSGDEDYRTFSVPDERAAAFTALGMALQNGKPAAVVCTSGSAAANFLPAVTEAFYQEVPLIIITADRPRELTGQGIGQTIDQENIYGRHIMAEAGLLRDPADELARQYNQRKLNEVLMQAGTGPVHINVPFEEPLYDKIAVEQEEFRFFTSPALRRQLLKTELKELAEEWNQSEKIWILTGQMRPQGPLAQQLDVLNEKSPFLLLSETLSNLSGNYTIASIDRLLNTLPEAEKEAFAPDLLISLGGEVVSKMVKKFLQQQTNLRHWHLHPRSHVKDTYHKLSRVLPLSAEELFTQLLPETKAKNPQWRNHWLEKDRQRAAWHQEYLNKAPFSDLKAFAAIVKALPQNSILHCANSASIRYSQLFDHRADVQHFANRGTSGIDGSTSTAVGHASQCQNMLTLVSGDVAFMYDNAALWNDRLPNNLRIIVLNNAGGNIFRIIKGPAQIEHFERFQETHHQLNLKAISDIYGVEHRLAQNASQLEESLAWLYAEGGLKILEVKTPRLESPEILAGYFKTLKERN